MAQIDSAWIAGLRDSLSEFASLLLDQAVVGAWSSPSALDRYTVGGIAGHVLGLMQALQYRLSSEEPVAEVIPYAAWYGGTFSDSDVDLHSALVAFGEDAASNGPTGVAQDLEACASALVRLLEESAPERLIALASVKGNAAVRLDDFVRTRFAEITVHADDIASSVGVATPNFPAVAWELTIGVLADAAATSEEPLRLVRALARPGRKVEERS